MTDFEDPDTSYVPQSPKLTDAYYLGNQEHVLPQHQRYKGSISHQHVYSPPQQSIPGQTGYFGKTVSNGPLYHPPLKEENQEAWNYNQNPVREMTENMQRAKRQKMETAGTRPDLGIEVRTKFPVARIKRIMQADDDVGKVAQVTPVAVSKALELFMISLVTKAAAEAKSKNQKRVSAAHLKAAVMKDDQFDFLRDIVERVQDAPASKDEDSDEVPGGKKKRSAGGRRKRKESDEL